MHLCVTYTTIHVSNVQGCLIEQGQRLYKSMANYNIDSLYYMLARCIPRFRSKILQERPAEGEPATASLNIALKYCAPHHPNTGLGFLSRETSLCLP
jgi:hypothetical protein